MLTDDPNFDKYAEISEPPPAPKPMTVQMDVEKEIMPKGWETEKAVEQPKGDEPTEESKQKLKQESHTSVPDKNKERLEEYLLNLLEKTSSGFTVVLIMYVIAFATGIGLIITALILAAQDGEGTNGLVTVFFGTAGTIDIVLLMYRPAREIQRSRANASKLAASVSEWFSISRGLDVAYKKLLVQGNIKDNFDVIKQIVELRRDTTIKLIETMDKYVASKPLTKNDNES